ncbi:MAG: substrate-binding domain-containing protein [Desulfosarcina sp.]|nr:substrate-binding domain-containing protein [Desulfobacterales bacterium]
MPGPSFQYPLIPDERGDDLHGLEDLAAAELVIFMAGNQFMVMAELIAAFRKVQPEIGPIYYEILPPKMELRQILAGGAIYRGQLIDAPADVYTSVSSEGVATLADNGLVDKAACFVYLRNRIALMVRAGNPRGIKGVHDLARKGLRISQPSLEHEDIAEHILAMYGQAGGEDLIRRILEDKQRRGETLPTTVHHRETPERLLQGRADAGPVWATEIEHVRRSGLPLEGVEIGPDLDQRDNVRYFACPLKTGRHPENARYFLNFLKSPRAIRIYRQHGFTPATDNV